MSAGGGDSAATGASTSGSTGGGGGGGLASFAAMCAAPGVIFCDGFEGGWDPTWIEDDGDVKVHPGGAVPGEGKSYVELSTYAGKQSSKLLRSFPESDEIYVRFDVEYAGDYDNSGGSHGPILGGSHAPPWGMYGTAGIKPNGSDFFVLNFEPTTVVGQGGEFNFYAYFVNMQKSGDGKYWGNQYASKLMPPPVVTPETWQCVEYGLKINTPAAEDGRADFWVDGVHHGSFGGFQWRTNPAMAVSTFSLDSYNHFNNGPVPIDKPNRVRYDNLVISTQRIGCLN